MSKQLSKQLSEAKLLVAVLASNFASLSYLWTMLSIQQYIIKIECFATLSIQQSI